MNKTKKCNSVIFSNLKTKKGQWLDGNDSEREISFLRRECAPSLYDSDRSDRRFSTEQEAKLFYAARAMRGH